MTRENTFCPRCAASTGKTGHTSNKIVTWFELDYDTFNVLPGHSCGSCNFDMDENVVPVFDDLPKLESSLPISVKESLNTPIT